ncbi:phosphotransferase [Dyella mobilis]|uniref:Phosphotransferase n=1 Tax=Dyella mobilis TaxID=1849582 RepID=A0ABS2KAJ8_9GAMM|nr:phosphotransferase [Dyella mobilis]MBM7128186.1 phosphotransferase [Dyella mobilis]
MCLLDHVLDWNDRTVHAIAQRHGLHDHPLRYAAGLHAVHLAEYGAQASAVHAALLAASRDEARMRPGRLVSLRDVHLAVEYVELSRGRLDVHAECLFADERGAQYTFSVLQNGQPLASGRTAVMYTDA